MMFAIFFACLGLATQVFADSKQYDPYDERFKAAIIYMPEITFSDARTCLQRLEVDVGDKDIHLSADFVKRTRAFWMAALAKASQTSHKTDLYSKGILIKAPEQFDYSWFKPDMFPSYVSTECGKIGGFAMRAVGITEGSGLAMPEDLKKRIKKESKRLYKKRAAQVGDCAAVSLVSFANGLSQLTPEEVIKTQAWIRALDMKIKKNRVKASNISSDSELWAKLIDSGLEAVVNHQSWDAKLEACL